MSYNSEQHIHMQEEQAYLHADRITEGGVPAMSLNEIEELFHGEPLQIPEFIPYMQRHAAMLEERNMLMDMCNYSAQVEKASLNQKNFWRRTYEHQAERLAIIESRLLDVESAAS